MEIKIKPTQEDALFVVANLVISLVIVVATFFIFSDNSLLHFFTILFAVKVFVYNKVELCLKKALVAEGSSLVIYCCGVSFPINKEKCFLVIENTLNISHSGTKHPTLNLHRNSSGLLSRFFKNKVKLHYVNRFSLDKIEAEAKTISETYGIRFLDDAANFR